MIQVALEKIAAGQHLSQEEAQGTMRAIMQGAATPVQMAAFLMGLHVLGETAEEIAGCALALREAMTPVRCAAPIIVDTCGTGGDGSGSFNLSTAAAFVVAGAGYTVAKHGNRSVTSRCGSADVLEALGVNVQAPIATVEQCLSEVGIGFLFAPLLHGAMRHAMPIRQGLRVRTVFNLLGPLVNPAGANVQLLGVATEALVEPMAKVLLRLGTLRAMVVSGARVQSSQTKQGERVAGATNRSAEPRHWRESVSAEDRAQQSEHAPAAERSEAGVRGGTEGGLDEISLSGESLIAEVWNGTYRMERLTPETFGVARVSSEAVRGGTKEENAAILRNILEGQPGPHRDAVLLNAACAILMAARAEQRKDIGDYRTAFQVASEALDSRKALAKLDALIKGTK